MPLQSFVEQAMEALAGGGDELAIGDARNLVAATNPETVRKVFARMNR